MTTTATINHPIDLVARHLIALALARAFSDPQLNPDAHAPLALHQLPTAWCLVANALPATPLSELGLGELQPSGANTDDLVAWLSLPRAIRAQIYQAVFGLVVSKECPAYETEFCHWSDPTFRAQQLADIAGFYHAFGLEVSTACAERQDHVSLELEFAAFLMLKLRHDILGQTEVTQNASDVTADALSAFIRDHIVWWMPTFARCLENRVNRLLETGPPAPIAQGAKSLSGVGHLLRAWVAAERMRMGVEPSRRIISPQVLPVPQDDGCEKSPSPE